jgi:hypothetical protein
VEAWSSSGHPRTTKSARGTQTANHSLRPAMYLLPRKGCDVQGSLFSATGASRADNGVACSPPTDYQAARERARASQLAFITVRDLHLIGRHVVIHILALDARISRLSSPNQPYFRRPTIMILVTVPLHQMNLHPIDVGSRTIDFCYPSLSITYSSCCSSCSCLELQFAPFKSLSQDSNE